MELIKIRHYFDKGEYITQYVYQCLNCLKIVEVEFIPRGDRSGFARQ